ncbi:MAG: outer membrane lipid asymmetry maintenance protein MlaD [Planctomycetota bacterium]|nr:outer membrane lipid asymmetry maintenance protein MlaD [Planctomycetota bacterium]MDA1138359.1 outer membrane lipid asymmetry maintenance protein MlaD [Planctomycetota bacterium]
MRKIKAEFFVGLFVLAGMFCLGYLSIRMARAEVFGEKGYPVHARFRNCGGLKDGASVMIAGVEVGRVKSVYLDKESFQAHVVMLLDSALVIDEESIASIKTKGLIGEKFIDISPGGAEAKIKPDGELIETEDAIDIGDLISKFVHGKI